jgi:hypothetical protein
MSNMLGVFSKPFPPTHGLRAIFTSAFAFGFFVAAFLLIFKPFGLGHAGAAIYWTTLAYGMVTTGAMLLLQWVTPWVLPSIFAYEKWTVGREIAQTISNIFLIAAGNIGLSVYLNYFNLSPGVFLSFLGFTLAIGIFPVTVGVLIKQNTLQKKYNHQSARFNAELLRNHTPKLVIEHSANPHTEEVLEKHVTLHDELGRMALELHSDNLVALVSADNYVKVQYLENGHPKQLMMRAVLASIEKDLIALPEFQRVHRSWIVNMNKLAHVDGNARGYSLQLEGVAHEVPVARSRIAQFDKAMANRRG